MLVSNNCFISILKLGGNDPNFHKDIFEMGWFNHHLAPVWKKMTLTKNSMVVSGSQKGW